MKGFYAPILGFVLVALAVGFGLYVIQAEKLYTGLLDNFTSKLKFITYGDISIFDVQTSLMAYVRYRAYKELNNPLTAADVINFVKKKVPAWINAFYGEVEKNTEKVIVKLEKTPRISGVSMKKLGEALLFQPEGTPGRISIDLSPSGTPLRIEKSLPLPSFILSPFPLKEANEVEENVEEAANKLEECSKSAIGKIEHAHFGIKKIHYAEKTDDYPFSCLRSIEDLKVNSVVVSLPLFELNRDCGVEEDGYLITRVNRLWKREKFSWKPPGLGKALEVYVSAAKDADIDFFPGIDDANVAVLVGNHYVFLRAPEKKIFEELNSTCHTPGTSLPFCGHHCFR